MTNSKKYQKNKAEAGAVSSATYDNIIQNISVFDYYYNKLVS